MFIRHIDNLISHRMKSHCRFTHILLGLGLENDRYGGVFVVVLGFLTVWAYFDDKRITPDRAEDMKRRQREIAENRLPKVKR